MADFLLLSSVGIKSPDGKRFVKSDEIAQDFVSSPAFDTLFMEIATDADKALQFVKGIMPAEFANSFDEKVSEGMPEMVSVKAVADAS